MKSSKIKFILKSLEPYTIEKHETRIINNNIVNIGFLDKQTVLRSDTVYISVAADPFSLLGNAIIYPGTVIVCCNTECSIPDNFDSSAFVYIVNTEYMFIYNLINDILIKYRDYHSFISFVQIEELSIEQTLRSAESKFKKHFYYHSNSNMLLVGHDADNYKRLIEAVLRLSDKDVLDTSDGIDGSFECKKYITDERIVISCDLSRADDSLGMLILVTGLDDHDDVQTLALSVARAVLLNRRTDKASINANSSNKFEQYITKVLSSDRDISQSITHQSEMFYRPVWKNWQLLIVKYDESAKDEQNMSVPFTDLQYAFSDMNIAIYRGRIIILFTSDDQNPISENDKIKLETILSANSFIAAEGRVFSDYTHFGNQLRILLRGLELCQILKLQFESRIYPYEVCKTYFLIDLALSSYQKDFASFDFSQLIHQDIITVFNYDKTNMTNLLDVLYIYLINSQNVNLTASQLYVHRNTVRNRINQLKDLISSDLDDPGVQFELLMSCFIIRYINNYMNYNIN